MIEPRKIRRSDQIGFLRPDVGVIRLALPRAESDVRYFCAAPSATKIRGSRRRCFTCRALVTCRGAVWNPVLIFVYARPKHASPRLFCCRRVLERATCGHHSSGACS